MLNLRIILAASMVSTVCLASLLKAQTAITLINPGFEDDLPPELTYFLNNATNDYPGWRYVGNYSDTGVFIAPDPHGKVHSGTKCAYNYGPDDGVYQISDHVLQEGETISLSWFAYKYLGGQQVSLLSAVSQNDSFDTVISSGNPALASSQDTLTGDYLQYNLSYTASSLDAGKFVGVYFDNTGTSGYSYIDFDDFSLSYTAAAVPEPSTCGAILGVSALISAFFLRRSKLAIS